jgi:Bacterial pre-peptidase C-terminal domain
LARQWSAWRSATARDYPMRSRRITPTWLLRISLFWLLALGAQLQAAPPSIESIAPGIGPRGQAFDVTLVGGKLKDVKDLLWYEPGLDCREIKAISDNEVRLTLLASSECRLGAHAFRVCTPGGLSGLKVVNVGRFSVTGEVEPNDDIKSARNIPLNTTVAGVVDSGDVDIVTVALKRNQRLSAEVQAIRLGGEMTDTVLTVFGPDGKVLATVDDTSATRQDPFISLLAPEEGTYAIQIRESSFLGGPSSTYALHVGDFPRPSIVFPPGGEAGKMARLTLVSGDDEREIATPTFPAEGGPWWEYYPTVAGRIAPTPTLLRVRPYACVNEPDAKETAPDALPNSHEWPVAFHGTIGDTGEIDAFLIRAHKGDVIQVESFAERIGSKLDTTLEIYDPTGAMVARNDDDTTHDSLIIFRPNADGAHRIQVADKRGDGGPGYIYRIEIEKPTKSLTLFLPGPSRKSQDRQVIAVPRGNRVMGYIGAHREGFEAPVKVNVGSLPSGVKFDVREIASGSYLAPFVVEAAADATLGATLVKLEGTATTSDGPIVGPFRQRVDLIAGSGDSAYESLDLESLAVVVTEEAPYKVSLQVPKTALARDGSISVVATVERAPGYDEALEVSLPYLPPGVEMEGAEIVKPGQSQVSLPLFARPDADPTLWRLAAEVRTAPPRRDRREMTLALMAQIDPMAVGGTGGMRRRRPAAEDAPRVSSRFIALELAPTPVTGRIEPASVEPGKSVSVVCTLEPGQPIPGSALATLEGLPPRAMAGTVKVVQGQQLIRFQVALASTTPVGEHQTLVCRLAGKFDGQDVVYHVGRGGLLKVNAPGTTLNGADGKPLSPLDALRLKERAISPKPSATSGKS